MWYGKRCFIGCKRGRAGGNDVAGNRIFVSSRATPFEAGLDIIILNRLNVAAVALKLMTTCSHAFPPNQLSGTMKFDHANGMLSRLTRIKTHKNPKPSIATSGAFQLNLEGLPSAAPENELRGVDAAESKSMLLVGNAEYGTHARDPRRNTRFADGIDHIPSVSSRL